MKFRSYPALFLLLLFTLFWGQKSNAQDLTGIWRGYFITEDNDQYKFELQLKQSPGKGLSGVSYSYLTTVFYGKATLSGSLNTANQTAVIQELKTVELRMSGSSIACIMRLLVQYTKSGKEEFLEGTYSSKYEKTDKRTGAIAGTPCGIGKVYLRKVPASDFYTEPFLKQKPVPQPPAPAPAPNKPAATPPAKKPVSPAPKPKPKPKPQTPPVAKAKTDTLKRKTPPPAARQEPVKIAPRPALPLPEITRDRKNELTKTISVSNNEITVRLYDNGEIDDDTISVYMDNKMVLSHQRLSASPLTLKLKMDEGSAEHVLVMVAENLGRIPPNTSLMIIQDGDKRYQVQITSTEQKNAMVRFRYEGSE